LTAIVTSLVCRPYDTRVRDVIQRAAMCACAAVLLAAAPPASGVSQRTITITLSGTGKALWKLDSTRETGRLALDYRWRGTLTFAVPTGPLTDPRHRRLTVASVATLVANWSGQYTSKKSDRASSCTYKGTNVKARVSAKLAKGRTANTLELTFHPRGTLDGFFSDKGHGAIVRCGAGVVQTAPPHFAPSWFFRDNLQDHGRLTSDTAIVVLAGKLLPNGSARVAFPTERGRNDSVALGHLKWSNSGTTVVRAR
jgi:hypothetical protein